MPPPVNPIHLTATATPATKSCSNGVNTWTNGINHLVWPQMDRSTLDYVGVYLQRSTVDDKIPYFPSWTQNVAAAGPRPDSLWTTLLTWISTNKAEVPPKAYDDVVPHSTFYYYRLIFQLRTSGTSPPFSEFDSGCVTAVQPFDLSICSTDSCTVPQQCTNRLVWDAPQLYVPFITAITHVGSAECDGATGCYKITYNWTTTPKNPTEYWVYKSYDSITFTKVAVVPFVSANTVYNWYDSDTHHGIFYRFDAQRPFNSVISSQVVFATY